MNVKPTGSVHWSFWAIGAVTLIWNVMGGVNFVVQMDADNLASFPETHRAIIQSRPLWASAGFAIAVFGGALGCLLLLLRKSAAYYLLILSFLGVILTMVHALGVVSAAGGFSPVDIIMMIVMPMLVAAFLVGYSWQAKRKRWIC